MGSLGQIKKQVLTWLLRSTELTRTGLNKAQFYLFSKPVTLTCETSTVFLHCLVGQQLWKGALHHWGPPFLPCSHKSTSSSDYVPYLLLEVRDTFCPLPPYRNPMGPLCLTTVGGELASNARYLFRERSPVTLENETFGRLDLSRIRSTPSSKSHLSWDLHTQQCAFS